MNYERLMQSEYLRIGAVLQAGDLIWLETPLNPTCEVADIQAYVAAAKAKADVHVVVDGTLLDSFCSVRDWQLCWIFA